jgi:signal transduction histidine kinase
MSSAHKPLWFRIAWSSFLSFGLLYLCVGVFVLVAIIRHHVREYNDMLFRLTQDLVKEYGECRGDISEMNRHFAIDVDEHGTENVFLLLSSPEGESLLSASVSKKAMSQMQENAKRPDPQTYRISCLHKKKISQRKRIAIRVRKTCLPDGNILSVGYNVTSDEHHTLYVGSILATSLLFTLAMGAWLGAFLARRITAPLGMIAATASRIAGGDYSARVPKSDGSHEIAELETAFNTMADEYEKTLSDLRTLTDDIAHDLRTPLTRLRAAAELHAMGDSLKNPLEETVSEETTAMLELINTMLDISQTNSRIIRSPREDIELTSFIRNVVDLYSAVTDECDMTISLSLPDCPVTFYAHKGKIQQIFGNLLDNAVKFTPHNGQIAISLQPYPLTITVSNTGNGILADDLPHVFKRFWRADSSRSLPGNGLGLALVKAIVTSYGGTVTCKSSPGEWTHFIVTFRSEHSRTGDLPSLA